MTKLWEIRRSLFSNQMTTGVFARTASARAGTHGESAVTRWPRPLLEMTTNPWSLAPHRCRVSWTARLWPARIGGIPDSSQMIEPAV
jgi:hypothetical protein